MAKHKKKTSRTLSPEHLAKMQEGRKRARVRNSRLKALSEQEKRPACMRSDDVDAILLKAKMHD